jgi:hypothetical protein
MESSIFESLHETGKSLKNRNYLSRAKDFFLLYSTYLYIDTHSSPNEETKALDISATLKCFVHPDNLLKPIEEQDFTLDETQEYWELGSCSIQIASHLCDRYMEGFISDLDGESRELFEIGQFLFEENEKNEEDPYEHRFDRWLHINTIEIKEEYRNKGLGGAFYRMLYEQFGFSETLVTLKSFPIHPSDDKKLVKQQIKVVKSFWKNRGFKKLHEDFVILSE